MQNNMHHAIPKITIEVGVISIPAFNWDIKSCIIVSTDGEIAGMPARDYTLVMRCFAQTWIGSVALKSTPDDHGNNQLV